MTYFEENGRGGVFGFCKMTEMDCQIWFSTWFVENEKSVKKVKKSTCIFKKS